MIIKTAAKLQRFSTHDLIQSLVIHVIKKEKICVSRISISKIVLAEKH